MWLKLVTVDRENEEKTELVNLDNVTTIHYYIGEHYAHIYLAFSNEHYTGMGFESAGLCEKEFNRLLDAISEALSGGKNLLVFETNYYGGKKS